VQAIDLLLLELVYGTAPDWEATVAELASWSAEHWAELLARWDVVRSVQRAYILAHPGCIPDRLERQRWLSRLLAATPRILAAAGYARLRQQLAPDGEANSITVSAQRRSRERSLRVSRDASSSAAAATVPLSDELRQARTPATAQVDGSETTVAVIPNLVQPVRSGLRTLRAVRTNRRRSDVVATGFGNASPAAQTASGTGDASEERESPILPAEGL
jgi:hypothetical protein